MDKKLLENVCEITMVFKDMQNSEKIFSVDQLERELELVNGSFTDVLKEDICLWAEEFEKMEFEDPDDYIGNITSFAESKISEKYGQVTVDLCTEYSIRISKEIKVSKNDYDTLVNGENPFSGQFRRELNLNDADFDYSMHHKDECIVPWRE